MRPKDGGGAFVRRFEGDLPSARILSAFASEIPLTRRRFFLGVNAMLSTVL